VWRSKDQRFQVLRWAVALLPAALRQKALFQSALQQDSVQPASVQLASVPVETPVALLEPALEPSAALSLPWLWLFRRQGF
jgi:hypothetical protein